MRKSIFIRALNREIALIQAAFTILLLAAVTCSFVGTVHFYSGVNQKVSQGFIARDSIIKKGIDEAGSTLPEVQKLREQYHIIEEIKKAYLFNALSFNAFGYAFTVLFAVASVITAILGFLLLRKGWDSSQNFYLKAAFLVMFFTSTLFKILPDVFDNKVNTKDNLSKYNYYFGLQMDIYDLVKDNPGFIRKKQKDSLNAYISKINRNIKENQDLYFDIHTDKIPSDIKLPLGE